GGGDADTGKGEKRRLDQLRADILLDLLSGADPTVPAAQGGAGALTPATPRQGTVNVTVELDTLLCLNDHPGELAGFGPIVADVARDLLEQQASRLTWRMSITKDGRFISEHRMHRKPT